MYYKHTHIIFDFEHRGKTDSFIGRCHCGKEEIFATWWERPPKGWSKKQWPFAVLGASLIIRSLYNSNQEWSDEELRKYLDVKDPRRDLKGLKKANRKEAKG